jgi:hypothetical protein
LNIVKSIFGAILIDTRENLEAYTATAENLGIFEYLWRIVAKDVNLLHPKNKLRELSSDSTVEYKLRMQDDQNSYSYKALVTGREIARVFNRSSKDDAMTQAADAAISELLADRDRETLALFSGSAYTRPNVRVTGVLCG